MMFPDLSHGVDPGGAIPPGGPAGVPPLGAAEGKIRGARADRESAGEHCVLGPSETGGVQWQVPQTRPNAEARAVAAASGRSDGGDQKIYRAVPGGATSLLTPNASSGCAGSHRIASSVMLPAEVRQGDSLHR